MPLSYLTFLLAIALVVPRPLLADGELPASLIRIPESVSTLFVAETSTAKFHRFDRSHDLLTYSGSFYMSIGKEGAGKERSGDKRTPFGAYIVTEQLDTTKLHSKYGVTAFPLDYPNAWDLRAGRDGDGIWVHGVDPKGGKRPKRDTDGCIALPNEDLSDLAALFEENITPVLVTREVSWTAATHNEQLRTVLEDRVSTWADSKARGDFHAYLSFYDEQFERWGMDKHEWSSLNLQTESLRGIESVAVSELLLVAYPEEEGVYLSRFLQTIVKDGHENSTTARLYWRRDSQGELKIIAEDNG
jgi:murein L,D-transpeptidase YafK